MTTPRPSPCPGDEGNRDHEAMRRLQQGDDLALNELMERWQRPLVNFIFRYVGSEADALDLAQEAFVRVYEHRDRYRAGGKFSTWLFAIAANLCRNLARWRTRHPTVPLEWENEDGSSPHPTAAQIPDENATSPRETLQAAEAAEAVREAVNALPHDLKTVVLLFEYGEQSYEEIARGLACTSKTVETRLYRARQFLRSKLAPWLAAQG